MSKSIVQYSDSDSEAEPSLIIKEQSTCVVQPAQTTDIPHKRLRETSDDSDSESKCKTQDFFNILGEELDEELVNPIQRTTASSIAKEDSSSYSYPEPMKYEDYAKQFKHFKTIRNKSITHTLNSTQISHIPEYNSMAKHHQITIKSVNQSDIIGNTGQYQGARDAIKESQANKKPNEFAMSRASTGNRRNNNIMYLAYQAKEHEAALVDQNILKKNAQKQSRKQYGF